MTDYRLEAEDHPGPAGLIERAHNGDLTAFEEIVRLHERQVLGTALGFLGHLEDAQDAAQEVFLKLYRHLKRLEDIRELRAWLYRVTANVCHDLRRTRRRWPTEELSGQEPSGGAGNPEQVWQLEERKQVVERALKRLPEKERAAVVLRDVEGLSTREVAEILGSSETTVRSQICSARMKMKQFTDRYLRKRI